MTIESTSPRPDDLAVGKAQLVLTALRSAALRTPFGFDQEQAEEMWGAALGTYSVDLLTAAAGHWILTNEEFPTLSEFVTLVRWQENEMKRDDQQARNIGVCPECEGARYVRVTDPPVTVQDHKTKKPVQVASWHMMPCPTCPSMERRHQLYMRGHFDAEHAALGGCMECREYYRPVGKLG